MKCRTCLGTLGLSPTVSIKEKISSGKTIQDLIQPFIPKMLDAQLVGFGDLVCSDCVDTLKIFESFIERCAVVEKYLKDKYIKKQLKVNQKSQVGIIRDSTKGSVSNSIVSIPTQQGKIYGSIVAIKTPKEIYESKVQKSQSLDYEPRHTYKQHKTFSCVRGIRVELYKNNDLIKSSQTSAEPSIKSEIFSTDQFIISPVCTEMVNAQNKNVPSETDDQEVIETLTDKSQPNSDAESENFNDENHLTENSSNSGNDNVGLVLENADNVDKTTNQNESDISSLQCVRELNINSNNRAAIFTASNDATNDFFYDASTSKLNVIQLASNHSEGPKRIILLGIAYHRCPICSVHFELPINLTRHLRSMHPDHPLSTSDQVKRIRRPQKKSRKCCPLCGSYFESALKFRNHLREVHPESTVFICEFCGTSFKTVYMYRNHVRDYKLMKNCDVRTCSICKQKVPRLEFNAHRNSHKTLECEECKKKFLYQCNLDSHALIHKKPVEINKKELCYICGKLFCNMSALRLHLRRHTGTRDFLCDKCSKTFTNHSTLQKHINYHHHHQEVIYLHCPICNKKVRSKHSLTIHTRLKHSNRYNKICHICGEGFVRLDYYKRHMKRHYFHNSVNHRNRKYVPSTDVTCKFCLGKYKNIHFLRLHLLKAHLNGARLQCQYCEMTFKNKLTKQLHEKRHQDPVKFELTCKVCFNIFGSKEKLETHMLKHEFSSRQKCDECGETFPSKHFLEHHVGTVHFDQTSLDSEREKLLHEGLKEFLVPRVNM